jgi:ribosome-binding factor A
MRQAKNESKHRRKTMQLCTQAYRCLSLAIASIDDDALLDASVESVEPAPDASRLLVTVQLSSIARAAPQEVHSALDRAAGRLRADLAADITRKRAPELAFVVRLAGEVVR